MESFLVNTGQEGTGHLLSAATYTPLSACKVMLIAAGEGGKTTRIIALFLPQ